VADGWLADLVICDRYLVRYVLLRAACSHSKGFPVDWMGDGLAGGYQLAVATA
jgi:hypothetical protein